MTIQWFYFCLFLSYLINKRKNMTLQTITLPVLPISSQNHFLITISLQTTTEAYEVNPRCEINPAFEKIKMLKSHSWLSRLKKNKQINYKKN